MSRGKMRGRVRGWGRCPIHGQWCCVADEIRANVMTRIREKRAWKRDAEGYRYFAQEATEWAEFCLHARSDGFR